MHTKSARERVQHRGRAQLRLWQDARGTSFLPDTEAKLLCRPLPVLELGRWEAEERQEAHRSCRP